MPALSGRWSRWEVDVYRDVKPGTTVWPARYQVTGGQAVSYRQHVNVVPAQAGTHAE